MIKQLHPTLKKCKCHYIGTKRELYKHFDQVRRRMKALNEPAREFWAGHGEVPLNIDDPKLDLQSQLEASLEGTDFNDGFMAEYDLERKKLQEQQKQPILADPSELIPSGHRLDDNNMEIPAR